MKERSLSTAVLPNDEEMGLARAGASELAQLLGKMPKADRALVKMENQDLILPRAALQLLQLVLAEMAQGNIVNIVPTHHLLTTQEAANLLNVSRPYLIGLLQDGKIPFSKVGTHRRIKYEDLMAYKQASRAKSERLLKELTRMAEEDDMGYG